MFRKLKTVISSHPRSYFTFNCEYFCTRMCKYVQSVQARQFSYENVDFQS